MVGLDDLKRSFPTITILRFYDPALRRASAPKSWESARGLNSLSSKNRRWGDKQQGRDSSAPSKLRDTREDVLHHPKAGLHCLRSEIRLRVGLALLLPRYKAAAFQVLTWPPLLKTFSLC